MNRLKKELKEFGMLIKSVPALVVAVFAASVLAMNLLANKSINVGVDWLALDCGIIVSWIAFLTMDMLTKRFGPKAATEISILAILINLGFCLIFFLASLIPGVWGEAGDNVGINTALDNTFGGTWYVVLGSTTAFIASAFINNFANYGVGKLFKKNPDGAAAYFIRSYVSTAIGQFADNLIFAFMVSKIFFGWSVLQCFTCALTGMVVELLCEVAFSVIGFKVSEKWKKDGVGAEYLDYINKDSKKPQNPDSDIDGANQTPEKADAEKA